MSVLNRITWQGHFEMDQFQGPDFFSEYNKYGGEVVLGYITWVGTLQYGFVLVNDHKMNKFIFKSILKRELNWIKLGFDRELVKTID